MSVADGADHRHEIIIVRHGHDDHDEGHHGGAWKIAFADFMTAMMCFFLVMWLINAANEQTKAAVASYFNPIKLVDRNAARKGLENLGDGPTSAGVATQKPKESSSEAGDNGNDDPRKADGKTDGDASSRPSGKADERLFADPYAVLSEIAADTGIMQNVSSKGDGGAQAAGPSTGASGGQSYRDPFSPDFWSQQAASPDAEATAQRAKTEGEPARPGDRMAESAQPDVKAAAPTPKPKEAPLEPRAATAQDKAAQDKAAQDGPASAAGAPDGGAGEAPKAASAPPAEAGNVEKKPSAAAQKAAADVEKQLEDAFKADKIGAGISAEATDKGVVISVTDQLDFGMYEIGSAVPSRELVLAMEKIGRIVNGQKGNVVIQGHTDARPFRSATYDNWRLSTARAHSAYYMLVRGGVDERRITEVAGFADREPKDKADPFAAANRRIEILLETDG